MGAGAGICGCSIGKVLVSVYLEQALVDIYLG